MGAISMQDEHISTMSKKYLQLFEAQRKVAISEATCCRGLLGGGGGGGGMQTQIMELLVLYLTCFLGIPCNAHRNPLRTLASLPRDISLK